MGLEQNKKVVSDFLSHFADKDVAGAMAMMPEHGTWWIGGKTELFPLAGVKTKAEMTGLLNNMLGGMQTGLTITPKAMVAEGDKVAVEAESYGVAANGRVYNNEYHFLFVIRDGKVESVKEYLDTMHTKAVFMD